MSTYAIWLALRRGWAGNGSADTNASPRLALHWSTLGLSFISKGRGQHPQTWKFHPVHRFHHLETRRTILIQKRFPISSAMLRAGLLSHGDELSWPSRSYFGSFSFCSQWTLLTIYYSNAEILLLFQFNVHCTKTFRALVIIYCH